MFYSIVDFDACIKVFIDFVVVVAVSALPVVVSGNQCWYNNIHNGDYG